MTEEPKKSWAEESIDQFFQNRTSPTREACDEHALSIANASVVRRVQIPGSLSYTVVCTPPANQVQTLEADTVVSFRQVESGLDENLVRLARAIHGYLVPQTTDHGIMRGSDPPLRIYTMPFLRGTPCLMALSSRPFMDHKEEAKHVRFIRDLARYYARCCLAPQSVDPRVRAQCQAGISQKLARLRGSSVVSQTMLSTLESIVPLLFAEDYPQVLTHGDLSETNLLVNPDSLEVTAIVDWSLASVRPFGLELDTVFLLTGCMGPSGWHGYACRPRLLEAFWAEFWTAAGIHDGVGMRRDTIRKLAEAAGNIGGILRYGFVRNPDGTASEEPLPLALDHLPVIQTTMVSE